jgi:hypothetical protein
MMPPPDGLWVNLPLAFKYEGPVLQPRQTQDDDRMKPRMIPRMINSLFRSKTKNEPQKRLSS